MGKKIGGIAKGDGMLGMLASPGAGLMTGGNNPLTKMLGLSGEQGDYFQPERQYTDAYGKFAADYDNQMGLAERAIQDSAITKNLFGAGGLNEQLAGEQNRLANQGFKLTQDDQEAYGQASGDISRLFGQQEQDVASQLARRGLSSGASGAAGALYSGIGGNKNEMLAKAQTDIANKRMQNTTQRLQDTRNMMLNLGTTGNQMVSNRVSGKGEGLLNAAKLESGQNQMNLASLEDKRAAKGRTLPEAFGAGLFSSAANIGATPGKAVSSAGGAAGAGFGKAAGGGMA